MCKNRKLVSIDGVVSVDATSLYPSIIMQHNLSPEMLAENHKPIDCTVESILERKHKPKLKDANLSVNRMDICSAKTDGVSWQRLLRSFLMTVNDTRNS